MREHLLHRTQCLAIQLSHLGIGPDLAALTLADLWGVYLWLSRISLECGHGPAA